MEAVTVDTPGRNFPQGAIRVSDAERDAAVAELSQHYQQGRLTVEEFDERSGQAFAAKTGDQLHALFADLPPSATSRPPLQHDLPTLPGAQAAARPGRSRGRVIAACVIGYFALGNGISAMASAASADWGSAISAIIPTLVLVLIALALIRRR
ncbi:MAG TPA: DUF1707 domain-containing protein [Trebonia sp.]|jgi:hypothetical protein|nr:DUF1707 domain-containing protein [Trebonia sp.]